MKQFFLDKYKLTCKNCERCSCSQGWCHSYNGKRLLESFKKWILDAHEPFFSIVITLLVSLYKDTFYKNINNEICENILRIARLRF